LTLESRRCLFVRFSAAQFVHQRVPLKGRRNVTRFRNWLAVSTSPLVSSNYTSATSFNDVDDAARGLT
jgi:hypothetical protein